MNARKDGNGRVGMHTTSKNLRDNNTILYIAAYYFKFNEFCVPLNYFKRA